MWTPCRSTRRWCSSTPCLTSRAGGSGVARSDACLCLFAVAPPRVFFCFVFLPSVPHGTRVRPFSCTRCTPVVATVCILELYPVASCLAMVGWNGRNAILNRLVDMAWDHSAWCQRDATSAVSNRRQSSSIVEPAFPCLVARSVVFSKLFKAFLVQRARLHPLPRRERARGLRALWVGNRHAVEGDDKLTLFGVEP